MSKNAKTFNCKKCQKVFHSISELRKHQWADHRETFKNLEAGRRLNNLQRRASKIAKSTTRTKVRRKNKTLELMKLSTVKLAKANGKLPPAVEFGFPPQDGMSAIDLIKRMYEQRAFLDAMIKYTEGMLLEQ